MKFNVSVNNISKVVGKLASLAGGSSEQDSIQQNIYLEVSGDFLTLKATDGSNELTAIIDIQDKTLYEEGATTINAQKLSQTLSVMPSDTLLSFTYNEDNEEAEIVTDSVNVKLRTKNAAGFPVFGADESELSSSLVLQQDQLKALIDKSLFCVPSEDFRDYLKGVRFEGEENTLHVFTSDGHRIAILKTTLKSKLSSFLGVSITKRCVAEMQKLLSNTSEEISLNFSKNYVVTNISTAIGKFKLASRLINCQYPNVRSVIPKVATFINIPTKEMKEKLNCVAILSNKKFVSVLLNFQQDLLALRAENLEHEVAESQLKIDYAGENIEISLNASYVLDSLNTIESDNVCFSFAKNFAHAVIEPDHNYKSELDIESKYIISRIIV